MLAAAIESTQSTDTKKVVQAIANGKYAGVTGEFSYDAKHDLKSSAVTVPPQGQRTSCRLRALIAHALGPSKALPVNRQAFSFMPVA